MKAMKKVFAILLVVAMVMGLGVTAFAQDVDCKGSDGGTITITNATVGQTYTAYKVFDLTYVEKYTEATYTEGSTETYYTFDENTGVYTEVADPSTATEPLYVKGYNVSYTYTKTDNTDDLYTALTSGYTVSTDTYTEATYDATSTETYYKLVDEEYVVADDAGTTTDQLYTKSTTTTTVGSPFTLTASAGNSSVYVVTVKEGKENEDVISFIEGIADKLTSVGSAEATENTVTFTNLDYGYYYITSSLGAVVTIDSTIPDATVIDKNTQNPGNPDKEIVDGDSKDATTADVGDTVKYSVTFTAVNYVTAEGATTSTLVKNYVVTDTPTNLALDTSTLVVKVVDQDKTEHTLTKDTDYTVTGPDATAGAVTVTINWAKDTNSDNELDTSIYSAPATVTLTYSAIVTGSAATTDTANNSVTLYYNNNTQVGTDTTNVKLFEFSISKVNADGDALTGAKFELYSDEAGTTKINLVAVMDTEDTSKVAYYRPATATEAAVNGFTSAVIEAGTATIKGLDDGTYYLKETAAPDGYNFLTSLVKVTIAADGAVTVGDTTNSVSSTTVSVVNNAGTELPSTGGIGTTIFYVVGSILVLGAAILLITKKRMNGSAE